jgi:hypothetical protein
VGRQNTAASENGICILCGQEKKGAGAKPDIIIGAARKLRELLKMPQRHTVACMDCLPECEKKRAEFEKKLGGYRIVGVAFFLILVAGSLVYGGFGLRAVLAGLVGAAVIVLLPYAKYFPKFE